MNNNSDIFDVTIIGGGVVGLSIAYQLSKKKLKILLIEKERDLGLVNSSRNTEVIHAGIYYKYNSLKAKLCLRGRNLLYSFCTKYKILNKKIGKLIIQLKNDKSDNLEKIFNLGIKNGVIDLKYIDNAKLKQLEPNISATNAILSPSSGILDTNSFIKTLEALNIENEVIISNNSNLTEINYSNKLWSLIINEDYSFKIKSRIIINSAGLNSLDISNKFFDNNKLITKPVKGSYLRYTGPSPFNSIIYPAFSPGIIKERVDATPDIWGGLRFGPSVETTKSLEDFETPIDLIDKLYSSIKEYFPKVTKNKLNLDISGIRPKIISNDNANMDFMIDLKHNGWVDLLGIESPGLTASLAIAEYVDNKIKHFF